jgi:hypothetical protein
LSIPFALYLVCFLQTGIAGLLVSTINLYRMVFCARRSARRETAIGVNKLVIGRIAEAPGMRKLLMPFKRIVAGPE